MRLKPLREQVVVVMGASSGMGRETALRLARAGAKVVVAARSDEGLDSLVEEIRSEGGEATAVTAEVADFVQVQAVADRAVEAYGHLDTWVHLAAVSLYATVEETTPEEYRHVIEVNLLGQIHGAKAALPHLRREGRGALIHVSSVESYVALPLQSAYASSKFGLRGFLDALRIELKHEGLDISVTNIMPAAINTPLFNKARTKMGRKPMGMPPIYQPAVVAKSIVYAAEHPIRDIAGGGAAKAFILMEKVSPRLVDAVLARIGFPLQKSDEPKSVDSPDAFDGPAEQYNRVKGDFSRQALDRSLYAWLVRHPAVRWALTAAALLAVVSAIAVAVD